MRWNRLVAPLVIAVLAGCGAAAEATPTCRPLPTASPVAATSGAVRAVATPGTAAPGQIVTLEISVGGPTSLATDCNQPVAIAVTDSAGLSVDEGVTMGTPPSECGPVTLGAGQTLSYEASWLPDATLPSGVYTVSVTVGDQAPVQLPLQVRTAAGGCG